jgi:hypothetical protein
MRFRVGLGIAALAAFFSGCVGALNKATSLQKQAEGEFSRGEFAACAAHMGEASATRETWWKENGRPDPFRIDNVALVRRMAQAHHVRAHCLKNSGDVSGAVGEMETAIRAMNIACQQRAGDVIVKALESGNKEATCQTAADDGETLARWKKELAKK